MTYVLQCLMLIIMILLQACSSVKTTNPEYERINSTSSIQKKPYIPSDLKQVKDIPQFENTDEHMAPGFLFSVGHPSDEKLKGSFRVQFDGFLRLPYGVKIPVKGLTFAELKKQVLQRYSAFFQRGGEDVTFNLLSRQYWVEVRGFVKRSGYYLVNRKETIDKVIDKAGGLSGNLKQDFFMVSIRQQEQSYSVSLNQYYENNIQGASFTWTGGDTIFINLLNEDAHTQAVPTVSVIGGVLTPGKILYKENATLFYYLQKTGGVIPNLGYEEAYVIRRTGKGIERIRFNITEMETVPAIVAGDVIMLNGERRTTWDKIWDRAVQVGGLLTTIAFLIIAL